MPDISKYRDRLTERLNELRDAADDGADERATVTLDQQSVGRLSRMDALQRQQMAKETLRRRNVEIARIEAALERMEEDEFGWCSDCGLAISEGRLNVDPTASLCIECAK